MNTGRLIPAVYTCALLTLAGIVSQACAALSPAEIARYNAIVQSIEVAKGLFARELASAPDTMHRNVALHKLRAYLCAQIVDSLAPFWYGTPWDFYGTSEVPGSGTIACGYFVSTILTHAGFKVERFKLAQQSAEMIVVSLASEMHIKRFSNVPLKTFCDAVRRMGEGLYVVGLDCHVGFLAVKDSEVYFLHSTYVPPQCAMIEVASQSDVLAWSQYRIVGKISDDDALLRKWVHSQRIATMTKCTSGQ
jgi:hypothetical protein